MRLTNQSGFTLIELLLSISIITILAGISLPVYQAFQNRNDLDISTQLMANTLRRAMAYSRAVSADSEWGVKTAAGSITLFKGNNFAGRDTAYDEITTISGGITPGGITDVYFAKLTGAPNTSGSINLSIGGDTRTVSLNAKGFVTY